MESSSTPNADRPSIPIREPFEAEGWRPVDGLLCIPRGYLVCGQSCVRVTRNASRKLSGLERPVYRLENEYQVVKTVLSC